MVFCNMLIDLLIILQTMNDPRPRYAYELTTSGFRVDEQGILVVADPHLDRDPPNPPQLQFQVKQFGFLKEITVTTI
jgi:hypothetical protein